MKRRSIRVIRADGSPCSTTAGLHPAVRHAPHFLARDAALVGGAALCGIMTRPSLFDQLALHAQGLFARGARSLVAGERDCERVVGFKCRWTLCSRLRRCGVYGHSRNGRRLRRCRPAGTQAGYQQ